MRIDITAIHENPRNARRVQPNPEADENLAASLATLGQLQPVLVFPHDAPGEWTLLAGHRRLRAARSLGWDAIEAFEVPHDATLPDAAISAAENMARAGMHPVDQWRAMVALRDTHKLSNEMAAAMLGIPGDLARRLDHLGRMAPEVIEEIAQGELPAISDLRLITMAPHMVQREALARAQNSHTHPLGFWRTVAQNCTIKRIPQSRAIFPHDAIAWDEDLFAQPDDPDRFSTADIDGFLAHQRAALEEKAEKANGRIVIVPFDHGGFARQKGWRYTRDDVPKRWRKDDPRRAFARLVDQGFNLGKIEWAMAEPVEEADEGERTRTRSPAAPRPPISKKTQRDLADLKHAAVETRLGEMLDSADAETMLRALLLIFTFRNVRAGELQGSAHGYVAATLVGEDGRIRTGLDEDDLCDLAARVITHAVKFDAPDVSDTSGPGAEWLAVALGADMPRTDTPDILKGITGDLLATIAEAEGVSARGSVGELRKRLAGALPNWRAATFGAEGPKGEMTWGEGVDSTDAWDEPAEAEDAA